MSLIMNLNDPEFHQNGTLKDVVHDFGMRYKRGELESIDKYFHLLSEGGAHKLLLDSLMERGKFEQMAENLDDFLQALQELPDIRNDLNKFCDNISPAALPTRDFIKVIDGTEHAKFIKEIVQYLVLNKEDKANSVLIWGAPNAGKTQFLIRFGKIFNVEYFMQTRGNFDCRYRGGRTAPHFIILEEGCLARLFDSRDKYVTAKLFLEGQGLMVEQKQKNPRVKWKGVPVIFTANSMPPVMREPKKKDNEEKHEFQERWNNYMAFKTRCRQILVTDSHSNREQFPYSTEELALYMQHLCNLMDPIDDPKIVVDEPKIVDEDLVADAAMEERDEAVEDQLSSLIPLLDDMDINKQVVEGAFGNVPKRKKNRVIDDDGNDEDVDAKATVQELPAPYSGIKGIDGTVDHLDGEYGDGVQ